MLDLSSHLEMLYIDSSVKKPNSGETLKFFIPNYNRNVISGRSNYPGMVTIKKISVRMMGYRGSKSRIIKYVLVIMIRISLVI